MKKKCICAGYGHSADCFLIKEGNLQDWKNFLLKSAFNLIQQQSGVGKCGWCESAHIILGYKHSYPSENTCLICSAKGFLKDPQCDCMKYVRQAAERLKKGVNNG